jgi:hypothetical protein
LSPSYAPAFQPASEIGPGVRSATLNPVERAGGSLLPQETRAKAETATRQESRGFMRGIMPPRPIIKA